MTRCVGTKYRNRSRAFRPLTHPVHQASWVACTGCVPYQQLAKPVADFFNGRLRSGLGKIGAAR